MHTKIVTTELTGCTSTMAHPTIENQPITDNKAGPLSVSTSEYSYRAPLSTTRMRVTTLRSDSVHFAYDWYPTGNSPSTRPVDVTHLEQTIELLERELDRKDRQRQSVIDRYEQVLDEKNRVIRERITSDQSNENRSGPITTISNKIRSLANRLAIGI